MTYTQDDLDRIDAIIAEGEERLARFRLQVEADRARGTLNAITAEVLGSMEQAQQAALDERQVIVNDLQRRDAVVGKTAPS